MTWQMVYWITRLDALKIVLAVCAVACVVIGIVCLIGLMSSAIDEDGEKAKRWGKQSIWPIVLFLVFLLFDAFLPSTKEACAIYLIPKVVNNEEVQKVPQNALKLLNAKLEEWIDEQIGDEDAPQD